MSKELAIVQLWGRQVQPGHCANGSLQHNELCMNSQKKFKKGNNEELPHQSKSKARRVLSPQTSPKKNSKKHALQKCKQRDRSKGSGKVQSQLSTMTKSRKRADADSKAETELGIPTILDLEDQKTVEEEKVELFNDFGGKVTTRK